MKYHYKNNSIFQNGLSYSAVCLMVVLNLIQIHLLILRITYNPPKKERKKERKYLQTSRSGAKATVVNGWHELGSHIEKEIEKQWLKEERKTREREWVKEEVIRDLDRLLPYLCWKPYTPLRVWTQNGDQKKVKGTVTVLT